MNIVEDQVRAALRAHAEQFTAQPDAWQQLTTRRAEARRPRWLRPSRVAIAAAAAAAMVGAGLAGTALLPAGHPAGARLAAYTVTKRANGSIEVTINELRDPAGLQATLRADGVPASVTFGDQQNPSCRPYGAESPALLQQVIHLDGSSVPLVLLIDPTTLPPDAGVRLTYQQAGPYAVVSTGLVQANPQCTG